MPERPNAVDPVSQTQKASILASLTEGTNPNAKETPSSFLSYYQYTTEVTLDPHKEARASFLADAAACHSKVNTFFLWKIIS